MPWWVAVTVRWIDPTCHAHTTFLFTEPQKQGQSRRGERREVLVVCWVAAKELQLSYHKPETILSTRYPYYGNLLSAQFVG